jgi:hypothetical protein
MSDGGPDERTAAVVEEARGRLARIAGREMLRTRAWWVIGAGAAAAMCRPLVMRLADEAPRWSAVTRAIGFFAAGSAFAALVLVALGRRRGRSLLGAARAVDEKLGLDEVVASGFAFARDGKEEPLALLARSRAAEALREAKIAALFPLPAWRPSWKKALGFAGCAAMAIAIGSYDRGLVLALTSPPTADEREAAAELEAAVTELAQRTEKPEGEKAQPKPERDGREKGDDRGGEKGPAIAETAREAARLAKRGDRKGAMEKLEALRGAGAKQAARASGMKEALRKMAEALASPSGKNGQGGAGKPTDPSQSAADSMRLLAQKMRNKEGAGGGEGASDEPKERTLERLERAAEEARRAAAGGKSEGASEAARSLSRAAEALNRGDREAAAQELEKAAERAAKMEQMRAAAAAEALAIAEMLEKSGMLERAIQMALLGREGNGKGENGENGKGEGQGMGREGEGQKGGEGKGNAAGALRSAILARLAAMIGSEKDGDPGNGSGPHMPDHHRSKRAPLEAKGSMRAPSQVGEGARAIQAINGLGKGSEPPASYREVFPSYDAAAEEGLADERVPASRRTAVRRYFQSIRPEQQ